MSFNTLNTLELTHYADQAGLQFIEICLPLLPECITITLAYEMSSDHI